MRRRKPWDPEIACGAMVAWIDEQEARDASLAPFLTKWRDRAKEPDGIPGWMHVKALFRFNRSRPKNKTPKRRFTGRSTRTDSQRGDWVLMAGKPRMIWSREHLFADLYEYTLANVRQTLFLLVLYKPALRLWDWINADDREDDAEEER